MAALLLAQRRTASSEPGKPAQFLQPRLAQAEDCCPLLCAFCKVSNGDLIPCPVCQSAFYCSARHLDLHRFQHKVACKSLQGRRAELLRKYDPALQGALSEGADMGGSKTTTTAAPRPASSCVGVSSLSMTLPTSRTFAALTRQPLDRSYVKYPLNTRAATALPAPVVKVADTPEAPPETPHFVQELGRASWMVLHAVAEKFPQLPSMEEQHNAAQFLESFASVFPCGKCRVHFKTLLRKHPPVLTSREAFVKWMSFFHDQVNVLLGKPVHGAEPTLGSPVS
eukprot:RCo031025